MSTVATEDREGGVRLLTFDRPPANAINVELVQDLSHALSVARENEAVRAIVLTGTGRFFSGGLDLADSFSGDQGNGNLFQRFRESQLELLTFPKPTVAMVNGHAVAGGLITALACDYRLGLDGDYKIGLNEVAIGASFPKVAFEIVRLRLTHAQASELLLGAALYPASEGRRLGVVDALVSASDFESTVLRRAARLASFPREAYAHTKAALAAEAAERVRAETEEEVAAGLAVWFTAESLEARTQQAKKLRRRAD